MQLPINGRPTMDGHEGSTIAAVISPERLAEFARRLGYAQESYRVFSKALGDDSSLTQSLSTLRTGLKGAFDQALFDGLQIQLKMVVNHFANEEQTASGRSGKLSLTDLEAGARVVVGRMKLNRRRPPRPVLRQFVEGLMALAEETFGDRARTSNYKNLSYSPHPTNAEGKFVVEQVRAVNPDITQTTISNMIKGANKKFAGKPMRYSSFYPGYGATITPF